MNITIPHGEKLCRIRLIHTNTQEIVTEVVVTLPESKLSNTAISQVSSAPFTFIFEVLA